MFGGGILMIYFFKPTDIHHFLDLTSCHPYHCKKKGIPYSQTLRLNRICSDNNDFDKQCNELESWLLEKVCSEKNGKETGFTDSWTV